MKKYIFIILLIFSGKVYSQVLIQKQKTFGGSGNDQCYSMEKTSDGGFVLMGYSNSTDGDVTTNIGSLDYWIVKIDSALNLQWEKSRGGTSGEMGRSIIQANDGGYFLTGTGNSTDGDATGCQAGTDMWVVKVNNSGDLEWQHCFGSLYEPDHGFDGVQTSDNGFIACGDLGDCIYPGSFNNTAADFFITKMDSSGGIQWTKCYGSGANDEAFSVIQTFDGGYLVGGYSGSNGFDVTVAGYHGNQDVWLLKLDSAGSIIWQKSLGGSYTDKAESVRQTADGGYILAGITTSNNGDVTGNHGDVDIWVVKTDSIGNIQWQKCLGGSESEYGKDIRETIDGGYILCGTTSSNDGDVTKRNGKSDAWVVKLDDSGNILWQKSIGGSENDVANSLVEISNGNYLISGLTVSKNGDIRPSHDGYEYWVAHITSNSNTISGRFFIDSNNNSMHDIGEPYVSNQKISEPGSSNFAFTNMSGKYYLHVSDSGNFVITPDSLSYYTSVPANRTINFQGINEIDSLNDFAFQPVGIANDLEIDISPVGQFRPGFNAHYNIHYKNKGTTSVAASIVFKNDPSLSFVTSSIPATTVTTDSIVWNITMVNPYEEGDILVTVNVNFTTPIGAWLNSSSLIEPVSGDFTPFNNTSSWRNITTGSFDPNDILVDRDTIYSSEITNLPELNYIIRFQNTGTDTAFTVRIVNNLTELLDINSFEFVSSSHPVNISYSNHSRVFEFLFENILLPDSNVNEMLSHGFIRYKIKPSATIAIDDSVLNSAAIYFDFNEPVITNTAVTEVVLVTLLHQEESQIDFTLFPNPAKSEINIHFSLNAPANVNVKLTNTLGVGMQSTLNSKMNSGNNKINLPIDNLAAGIYFCTLSVDGRGSVSKKMVVIK